MTTPFDPAPEPDDRPATVGAILPAVATAPVPRRRPRRWPAALRGWLGLSLVVFVAVVAYAFFGLHAFGNEPVHVIVDGDDLTGGGLTLSGLTDGSRALLALGLGLVALFVLVILPVLLLLVIAVVLLAVLCGIAVPLLVVAMALVVSTSPIWVTGLVVWMLLRRHDTHRLAGSATMPA